MAGGYPAREGGLRLWQAEFRVRRAGLRLRQAELRAKEELGSIITTKTRKECYAA
jgi:hypothetical protein